MQKPRSKCVNLMSPLDTIVIVCGDSRDKHAFLRSEAAHQDNFEEAFKQMCYTLVCIGF